MRKDKGKKEEDYRTQKLDCFVSLGETSSLIEQDIDGNSSMVRS